MTKKELRMYVEMRLRENAIDIGQDAIVGSRDSVRARKAEMRRDAVKNDVVPKAPSRASEIARLEAELASLMALLKRQ